MTGEGRAAACPGSDWAARCPPCNAVKDAVFTLCQVWLLRV